jgi:hypothetical protein
MPASLSGVFNVQQFTDIGTLAVGGRIYTYAPSTTTHKTAYTDQAGTISHTYTNDGSGGQYIALNARGELPAPLFLTSGGYDIAYKTAAGVTVWTRRAIAADPDAASEAVDEVLLQLAESDGSSLVGFIAAGTGANARTAQSKMRESVSASDFGASIPSSTAENKTALQEAIAAVDAAGGGVVRVGNGIDYGYKTTDISTYPSFAGVVNDVTVIDEGIGDADNAGNKTGAQTRVFYYTKQTTPTAGMHDGNGHWVYGDWHPYYSIMNTANLAAAGNPSRTAGDNRRASIIINNDGQTTWRIGQGTLAGTGYTNEELSNFVIEHFQATGDTLPNYAPMLIERKTGNWSFGGGTNAPPASYHFKSITAGYAQAMFHSLGTTSFVVLRNSNGSGEDVELKNVAGDFVVTSQSSGNLFAIKKTTRFVGFGTDSPGYRFDVQDSQANGFVFNYKNTSTTNGSGGIIDSSSSNGVGWNFLRLYSSNQTDQEFYLRGDGNAAADGAWSGGGADYAEYFEWQDGNPNNEDRRGYSVSLVGDKIKKASTGEVVIGVISGNPSVVGDAAWNKWSGKYLRDDFGSYTRDQNGERVLSEDYDPEVEYTPRELRKEWDCVGLMGKLRVRKGQPTDQRWVKMRDVSASVEEWLIK